MDSKSGNRPVVRSAALVLGVATLSAPVVSPPEPPPAEASSPTAAVTNDPRVLAFVEAYSPLIDSVEYRKRDAIFHMGSTPIHFRNGRMVSADRLKRAQECDPIFYSYPLEPLSAPPPPPPDQLPRYCSDLMESLWGDTESEIREHGRSVRFLGHRMFVNEIVVAPLAAVERDVRRAAATDAEVAAWIEDVSITYSFISREIAGSSTPSQHAFGLAVDLVPRSYGGRHVYWRWSRALDRAGWSRIPLERRWSPPASVVRTFERHGFVWGGKWARFDAIHFEYRPEILGYSRLLRDEAVASRS